MLEDELVDLYSRGKEREHLFFDLIVIGIGGVGESKLEDLLGQRLARDGSRKGSIHNLVDYCTGPKSPLGIFAELGLGWGRSLLAGLGSIDLLPINQLPPFHYRCFIGFVIDHPAGLALLFILGLDLTIALFPHLTDQDREFRCLERGVLELDVIVYFCAVKEEGSERISELDCAGRLLSHYCDTLLAKWHKYSVLDKNSRSNFKQAIAISQISQRSLPRLSSVQINDIN